VGGRNVKRSLKALLVAGAATAALVGPAAVPAHAATCVGFVYETPGGLQEVGRWTCDEPCPPPLYFFDGRLHVIICFGPS
jgi:hypothetical protein